MNTKDVLEKWKNRLRKLGPIVLSWEQVSVSGDSHDFHILFESEEDAKLAQDFMVKRETILDDDHPDGKYCPMSHFSIRPYLMETVYTFENWVKEFGE